MKKKCSDNTETCSMYSSVPDGCSSVLYGVDQLLQEQR